MTLEDLKFLLGQMASYTSQLRRNPFRLYFIGGYGSYIWFRVGEDKCVVLYNIRSTGFHDDSFVVLVIKPNGDKQLWVTESAHAIIDCLPYECASWIGYSIHGL